VSYTVAEMIKVVRIYHWTRKVYMFSLWHHKRHMIVA